MWAWGSWVLTMALLAVGAYFLIASRNVPFVADWGFRGYPGVIALPFATIGAVVAAKRPGNPIGWLMCGVGVISGAQMVVEEYAIYASATPGISSFAQTGEWIGHWIWLPAMGLLTTAVLLFPTGSVIGPRWRWVGWITLAGTVAGVAGFGLSLPERIGFSGSNPLVDNPIPMTETLGYMGLGLLYVGLVLAAAAVVVRMRRARGDERQQLKWLVLAAAMLPVSNLIATLPVPQPLRNIAIGGITAFPIGMGIAMLKFRLYEIDHLINRTLVYGGMTAILAATYLGVVFVLQEALAGITEGSSIAVAASTLAVAALFSPLRGRVQRFIDARFYRTKYDARRTVDGFAATLRSEVDLDALTPQLLTAVRSTVEPNQASVWLRDLPHAAPETPAP